MNPQQKFELLVAATMLANELGDTKLQRKFALAASKAAAVAREARFRERRAEQRGKIQRVANESGQYQ